MHQADDAATDRLSGTAGADARRRRRTARLVRTQTTAWASVLIGLAAWELIGRLFVKNQLFLATPLQAIESCIEMWGKGELQVHIWVSTQEFVIGFVLACILGIVIGLLIAASERAASALNPWISGIYATPIIAVSPLFILWFGVGIWSKVAVVIALVVFPVIINTEVGIRSTDRQLVEAVRAFGATPVQVFTKVALPSAMPFILAGVRLGVGRGLIGVVAGELFGARAGLGFLIISAAESFDMAGIFAGILVLAGAGIVLTAAFRRLERRLVPWN
jgi:NitT/TauT family transport system permease protein